MDFKRPESVLVIVATEEKEILCLRRQDMQTFWQSVTGSLLPDEKPLNGALRELTEETGLTSADGILMDCQHSTYFEIYPQWRHRYPPGVTQNLEHVFCFWLKSKKEIKISREHIQYCWLSKDEAIKLVTSASNKNAIEQFI